MDLIRKYKIVIAVILPILILVIIRSLSANHFKTDAKKWAGPSFTRSNLITEDQSATLTGKKLIVNLGNEKSRINETGIESLNIPADSILSKNILYTIRKHDGPVLLYSSEPDVIAKVWMVLSQMGYRNIFILTNDADNEVLKNNFRPDSVIRPEM